MNPSSGQISSGVGYMLSNYIETGVSGNGRLYSGATPPAAVHTSRTPGLGLLVDIDKDGWAVGSPPYYGDWFKAGSPVEEWTLLADNTQYYPGSGDNTIMPIGAASGSVVSHKITSSVTEVIWRGYLGSISLEQIYIIPHYSFRINILVRIKNTGTATVKNLYYGRNTECDFQDATELWGFGAMTRNRIQMQPANGDGAVWIRQTATPGRRGEVNMASVDCRAKGYIIDLGLTSSLRLDSLYDGLGAAASYYFNVGRDTTQDMGMGIVFKLDSLAAGDSTSLSLMYDADSGKFASVMSAAIEPYWKFGSKSYKSGDTVKVCPTNNYSIDIINPGSNDWRWDAHPTLSKAIGAANTFSGAADTPIYRAIRSASSCYRPDTLTFTTVPHAVVRPTIYWAGDTLKTLPDNYISYQWVRNGLDVAGATDKWFAPFLPGCFRVTVTDSNACVSNSDTLCNKLSVAEFARLEEVIVSPNPARDQLFFRSVLRLNAEVADISGKVLLHQEDANEISLQSLAPGVYLLRLSIANSPERKLIKIVKAP
jgi:hypothetical protein